VETRGLGGEDSPDETIHARGNIKLDGGATNTSINLYNSSEVNTIQLSSDTGTDSFINGGNVGVGTTTPDERLHVQESDASATASTNTVLVVERNDHVGIQLLCPNDKQATLVFGDPEDNADAFIQYDHLSSARR